MLKLKNISHIIIIFSLLLVGVASSYLHVNSDREDGIVTINIDDQSNHHSQNEPFDCDQCSSHCHNCNVLFNVSGNFTSNFPKTSSTLVKSGADNISSNYSYPLSKPPKA
tara:strand:+ start:606 stop:935 length:330 start_codon:yes stop_codon:yes gene_type:complete